MRSDSSGNTFVTVALPSAADASICRALTSVAWMPKKGSQLRRLSRCEDREDKCADKQGEAHGDNDYRKSRQHGRAKRG